MFDGSGRLDVASTRLNSAFDDRKGKIMNLWQRLFGPQEARDDDSADLMTGPTIGELIESFGKLDRDRFDEQLKRRAFRLLEIAVDGTQTSARLAALKEVGEGGAFIWHEGPYGEFRWARINRLFFLAETDPDSSIRDAAYDSGMAVLLANLGGGPGINQVELKSRLKELADARAVDRFVAAFFACDGPYHRAILAGLLAKTRDPRAISFLIGKLQDQMRSAAGADSKERRLLVEALLESDDEEALKFLRLHGQAESSENEALIAEVLRLWHNVANLGRGDGAMPPALQELGEIASADTVRMLFFRYGEQGFDHDPWTTDSLARMIVPPLGDKLLEGVRLVLESVSDCNEETCKFVAAVAGHIGDPSLIPLLDRVAEGATQGWRGEMSLAAARIRRREGTEPVKELASMPANEYAAMVRGDSSLPKWQDYHALRMRGSTAGITGALSEVTVVFSDGTEATFAVSDTTIGALIASVQQRDKSSCRVVGRGLYEVGGLSLMVAVCKYLKQAQYEVGALAERYWSGIGEWRA
jgi:HEAT repeat protein